MKVQRDLIITDIPGFESITVQHDAGEAVLIKAAFGNEYTWSFDLEAITTLRDALNMCIEEMQRSTRGTTEPRVFTGDDREPFDVSAVADKDGDRWSRGQRGDWACGSAISTYSQEYVIGRWGPLTEAAPE